MKIIAKARISKTASPVDGEYNATLKPDVYLSENMKTGSTFYDVSDVPNISIPFQIDLGIKSWGINGATISLTPSNIPVGLVITEYAREKEDQEYSVNVNLDLSKINLRLSNDSSIMLKNITLYLTDQFEIDYERSYIEGSTL